MQQLRSCFLTATINHFGAEICSVKNTTGTEFIWQAEPSGWARHAPVLFPIVGKLKDNRYVYKGTPYELGQHGFARDREFELIECKADSCTFQLASDDTSRKLYPFDFFLRITYKLEATTLTTEYKLVNPSQQLLLFSIGAHPGFNCPLLPGENMEDYYLEFERSEYKLTELSNGLRTAGKKQLKLNNNRLFLSPELFNNDALVFEDSQINTISLCSSKSTHKFTMSCEGWPYFGIWSKPGQPFVCLEPWYGITDKLQSTQELTEKDGILQLKPGGAFECRFAVKFD